ncbi:carboxylating nicotinate-nucleotide diphosphorylase [methanotrophic endosymbiont of Bathymodiolus puteoserpentis (Logatchev)]|jgi:nicotinate-nucleotide pyrophosphorylase (carboxylating)|uniref:carboxylating nicotinate-nucleotide diphosphorylase n=1 Tax=methanotrophic endosymbiont of Bathymodiolus puteoserpentis (Logatchev) TaxID=343235 RepID=UPI0013CCF271|nr:carboxylating nicotinate-nucleotide diphosphorylase [methanotrophic endosymbiont of Bathymodiolus puteoserpentis (Logatchev)]SHE23700.1 Quinolinate phosphoribosyltransferase [decarboxylating] [methanotrophic endosymbiont of Bathymodiolus puteoserpentis (Logatchev)]
MNYTAPINVKPFLDEDIGSGDITVAIISETMQASAKLITREPMVCCGQDWFNAVFKELNADIEIEWLVAEGQWVEAGMLLCTLRGLARPLLTGERTALNLLQTLAATATYARQYANAVAGTGCKVLDTRKTIPGLRNAQKYAVVCGGCHNHRMGLYDAVLIKENHIMAAGSIAKAVAKARQISDKWVEVEVENMDELQQALDARPDRIMLDNFSVLQLLEAVKKVAGTVALEASGNISLANIREIAETGVDYISIGALTKNVTAVDLSMRIDLVAG